MDSIYFNRLSYFSSKLSAGGAIETCRAVVKREVKNAIAVIRPPGHHAEVSKTMGFCLFNNVCIASRVCQKDFGPECRKILILDWYVPCKTDILTLSNCIFVIGTFTTVQSSRLSVVNA
jgi:histone deacetylase 6